MQDEGRERKCASVRESVFESESAFQEKELGTSWVGEIKSRSFRSKKSRFGFFSPRSISKPPPLPKFHQNQPRLFPVRSLLASIDGEGPSFECFNVEEDLKLSLSLTHTHEHTLSL